jgi:hypothetical protein
LLTEIPTRRLRARGALAIALGHPQHERALDRMLDALGEASRGGVTELGFLLQQGRAVIARASPQTDFMVLEAAFLTGLAQARPAGRS